MIEIDQAVLTEVVCQAQNNPDFEVLDWKVETLSNRGGPNPDGLLRVSGQGHDGESSQSWAVALKFLKKETYDSLNREWSNPDQTIDASHLWNWQREVQAYSTGLLANLPGPLRAAGCYGVHEHKDSAWIWLELLTGTTAEQWTLEDYAFAADQVARFNAACLKMDPIPDAPWLVKQHSRVWNTMFNFESAWSNPHVQSCFSPNTQKRLVSLWEERERFFATLEQLPQVFSHFDYKSSNLFIQSSRDKQKEIVAIDWGDCGIGALGGDLVFLVGASAFFFDWDPAQLELLHQTVLDAYLNSLLASDWQGDPDLVKLGYFAWMAMHFAAPVTTVIQFAQQDENKSDIERLFRQTPEDVIKGYPLIIEFALECADEARKLMKRFDLP